MKSGYDAGAMTAHELLRYQLDDAGYQITQVMSGFPEIAMDVVPVGFSLSPRQTVMHLTEAYMALLAEIAGKQHEWGSYDPEDKSTEAILADFVGKRAEVVEGVLNGSENLLVKAHMYIVGHDYYHVGQLCLARLSAESEWDFFSIYRS